MRNPDKSNISGIRYTSAFICFTIVLALSVACSRTKSDDIQYIEALGLYFKFDRFENSVIISFGEKKDSVFPNYFETYITGEVTDSPFYFIVDNTSGTPTIRNIFFDVAVTFYDIHIPDYPYAIELNPLLKKKDFSYYFQKRPRMDMDSANRVDYYTVRVYQESYGLGLNFTAYDMSFIENMDSVVDQLGKSPDFIPYSELIDTGRTLDYKQNTISFGEPKVKKRYTITKDNRKAMIRAGWLFIATMDISEGTVLEIDKWLVDDRKVLSVIYRIGPDGDRTPVNGALYPDAMERFKLDTFYK